MPMAPSPMSPVLPRHPAQAQPAAPAMTATPVATLPAPRVGGAGAALALDAGSGRVVTLGAAASSVFAADPKVAEVRPASSNSLFIFGRGSGTNHGGGTRQRRKGDRHL